MTNPYREALLEDRARQHWEDHELCMTPMHVAHRRDKAARAGMTQRAYEEALFQKWHGEKKQRGFANFDTDWIDSDDEEA